MRLFIDYDLKKIGGKAKFIRRLIPALEDINVKCTVNPKDKHDVALGVSYWRQSTPCVPRLLRIDGVHLLKHDKQREANKRIKRSVKESDGVIWQSEFCKEMCMKMYGLKPKKEFVIYNGASPEEYKEKAKSKYMYNVITSARFKNRPQKGLKQMIKTMEVLLEAHSDVCFWVAGRTELRCKHPRIKMLGEIDDKQLSRHLAMADVFLYLAAYDWCPNAVVEALCAGLPVVYIRGHGVDEIVGNCGIGIRRKKPIALDFTEERIKPSFYMEEAITAIERLFYDKTRVYQPVVDIKNVAAKYKEAFEGIL